LEKENEESTRNNEEAGSGSGWGSEQEEAVASLAREHEKRTT